MRASFAADRAHNAPSTKRASMNVPLRQATRSPVCAASVTVTAPAAPAVPAAATATPAPTTGFQAPETPLDPNVSFERIFGAFGTGQLNGYIGTRAHNGASSAAEEKVGDTKNVWIRSFCMDKGDGPHLQVNLKEAGGAVQEIREQDGNVQAQWTFSKSEHLQWDGLHHPYNPDIRVIGLAEGVYTFCLPQVRGWGEKIDPAAVASSQPTTGSPPSAWYGETFFDGRAKGDSCMKGRYKGLTRTSTGAVYSAMPEVACSGNFHIWEPYQTHIDVDAKLDLQALFAAAEQLPGPALPSDPSSWLQPILGGAPVTVRLSQVRKDHEGQQLWESFGTSTLIPGSSGVTQQGDCSVWPWKLSEMEVPEGYQVITYPDGVYLIVPKLMQSGIPSSNPIEAAKHHGWGIEMGIAGYSGRYVRVRTCFLPDGRVSKWHVAEYGVAHGESWDKQQ